jgi:hypothetical protein
VTPSPVDPAFPSLNLAARACWWSLTSGGQRAWAQNRRVAVSVPRRRSPATKSVADRAVRAPRARARRDRLSVVRLTTANTWCSRSRAMLQAREPSPSRTLRTLRGVIAALDGRPTRRRVLPGRHGDPPHTVAGGRRRTSRGSPFDRHWWRAGMDHHSAGRPSVSRHFSCDNLRGIYRTLPDFTLVGPVRTTAGGGR